MIDMASQATAVQFALVFDPDQLQISGNLSIYPGNVLADHGIRTSLDQGRLSVAVLSTSLKKFQQSSGVLVQITIEPDPDLDEGSTVNLFLTDCYASDESGKSLSISGEDGRIQITSLPPPPLEGQNQLIFPQVANGGGYTTTIVMVNGFNAPAKARLGFYQSGAQPFDVVLEGGTGGSSVNFSIQPKGSIVLRTDGSGSLNVGYALLSSSVPLSGILIFTLNRGKEIVTEAGVPPSPLIRNFSIPVLFDETAFDTGLAVFNIQGVKAVLDLRVRKSDGEVVFRKTVTLSPYEHLPLFATQLFPELSQLGQFEGVIEAASDQAVAVIAMKLTGHVLTTFPVSKSN